MKYYSDEIVFRGHPDKVCDQISDALLTEYLKGDPNSRCGIEVAGGKGIIFITGEVTSTAYVNVEKVVKSILFSIGYDPSKYTVINNIGKQSQDIALGTNDDVGGAGDQGMMFGYACNDTEFYVPVAMHILQELSIWYNDIVHKDEDFLPDGKAQITGVYDDDFKLVKIKDFTISYQNRETNRKRTDKIVRDKILELCDGYEIENFHINPTGKFLVGGFEGDAGLTGRKIVVDNYQSFSNVGGGCVDGDTEFLTPYGWKRIADYDEENDFVGQWDSGNLSFVKGVAVKQLKTKMYHCSSPCSIDMVLSEDHNFLYRTSKKNYRKIKFKDVIEKYFNTDCGFRGEIPLTFSYEFDKDGLALSDDEIRLQVAFCADGTILNGMRWGGRIRVKKDYKKKSIEKLLTSCGYDFAISKDKEFNIYYFNPPMLEKRLHKCFNKITKEQAKIIAEEVVLWDGNRKNIYRTTIKKEADFVQFLFISVYERSSWINVDDRVGEKYGNQKYLRKSICYEVSAGKQRFSTAFRKTKTHYYARTVVEEFNTDDKYMYCINVPSHNLVLRRNNKVFITGNCYSGKDCTKVDRSGAYKARQLAIRMLKEYNLKWCEVQVSYAIGIANPLAIYVDSNIGNITVDDKIYDEFKPANIIKEFDLKHFDFTKTSMYGHFGNNGFPWECV